MSLAVEQTLPSREVNQVDRRESGSHAAEPYNMHASPSSTVATGREEEAFASFASSAPVTKSPARSSYDMQRQYQDAMEDHEITTPISDSHVVEEPAPVLPQKSALRASRLLAGLKISPSTAEPLELAQTHHHEEYLSSEEDASSTSGDFSDFEYDSSSDDVPSPTEECGKHEVTARVVSVIFSGKPSVIEVPQSRRSVSPNSIERPSSMGGLPERTSYNTTEVKSRRISVSTTASSRSSRSTHPKRPLPPRSSSMQPPNEAMKAKLGFLSIDPYANRSSYSLVGPILTEPSQSHELLQAPAEEVERPKTPKSPASVFRGVARAMSLMKKRSTPRLSQASHLAPDVDAPSQPSSPTPMSIPEEPLETPTRQQQQQQQQRYAQEEVVQHRPEPTEVETAPIPPRPSRQPPKPQLQPVTHNDIIRISKRNEQQNKLLPTGRTFHGDQMMESPISPMSPLTRDTTNTTTNTTTITTTTINNNNNKRMSSFGFGRRRMSVKLTGSKFQL